MVDFNRKYDVLVIGGGNAALCAAISAARLGASVLVLDREMDGGRLFEEVEKLRTRPELLHRMGERARAFAHPDAARRAANVLEEAFTR